MSSSNEDIVYISLGINCSVKYQIDKHKGKKETLFFDWLITTFRSIIEVIGCDNIDTILNKDTIIKHPNHPCAFEKTTMLISSLTKCISMHDISKVYDEAEIVSFIDKYKRRYERIINYIKSDSKLVFIRAEYHNDPIQEFIDTILHINPSCNFTLVIIDNKSSNTDELIKQPNLLHIKINEPIIPSDWKTSYLNWEHIFSIIDNNIC